MEYSPPPLFKQGASARAKVIIFALIAIVLLVVDARFRALTPIRQVVGVALYPLQVVALLPRDAAYAVGDYFVTVTSLQKENQFLKQKQVANAKLLQEGQLLQAENVHLRQLLSASERLPIKSVLSEILYDTRDSFTRKIVLDRGSRHGIAPGQPVIDDIGVVGQVTRVFPFTCEVTLLTDKDHAIPVQVLRSGLRSVAYGKGQSGVLDLRFMAANADIRKGDMLVTSGIDGVYPPGLSVATVQQVEHKSSDAFAHITLQPAAGIDRNRQLLILLPDLKFPPRPEPEEPRDSKKDKGKKKPAGKEGDKAGAKEGDKSAKPDAAGAQPAAPAAANAALPAAAKAAAPVAGINVQRTAVAAVNGQQPPAAGKAPAAAPAAGTAAKGPTPAAPKAADANTAAAPKPAAARAPAANNIEFPTKARPAPAAARPPAGANAAAAPKKENGQ